MSFNLRIDVTVDGIHAWDFRKSHVFDFIRQSHPDLIGFQEASFKMLSELKAALPDYEAYGIGRDERGEGTPVFVRKNMFKVIASDTFWLSDTPLVSSKMDGSHFPRIATYVVLESEAHDKILFVNTHLDYAGDDIATRQAKILLKHVKALSIKHHASVIITGDFNMTPASKTIRTMLSSYRCVYEEQKHLGLTFHGFSSAKEGLPIDYIFYSEDVLIMSFSIIHHDLENQYLSDHYPIMADVAF